MKFAPTEEQKTHWRRVRTAFDPWHRSTPKEIDRIYAERPGSPSTKLSDQFDLLGDGQYLRVVLCGARGSGKSTELARLDVLTRGHFSVLRTDLEAAIPNGSGTLALIAVVGLLAEAGVRLWSQPDAEQALVPRNQPAFERSALGNAMKILKIGTEKVTAVIQAAIPWLALSQGSDAVPEGTAETARAIATSASALNQLLAQMLSESDALRAGAHPHHRAEADALIQATNERLEALRTTAGKPAIFLLDGLDRTIRLDAIKELFHDVDLLRRLETNIVLCGPIAVRHEPTLRAVAQEVQTVMLENIAIRHNDETHTLNEDGVRLLVDIYKRRCAAWGLETSIVDPIALLTATQMSAGLVRDFLDLVWRASASAAKDPGQHIDASLMERAVGERRREMQGFLKEDRIRLLTAVLTSKKLPEGPAADELLFENFIGCYSNGDVWFRPHELLVDWLERVRAEDDARRSSNLAT